MKLLFYFFLFGPLAVFIFSLFFLEASPAADPRHITPYLHIESGNAQRLFV